MIMGCSKCNRMSGLLLIIFGLVFLLVDLHVWTFWGINWWSVLFILVGVVSCAMSMCADCCAMTGTPAKKR